jgi:hypothetical protein
LFGVAQGTDEPRKDVVGDGEWYRQEVEQQKDVGVVENIRRRIDDFQNPIAEDAGENGYHHGDDGGYAERIAHIRAHIRKVFCTERTCHGDGESCARTVAEPHNQKHDGRRRTHGSECAHTYPPPHDGSVDDEIHLLQDVSAYQRQRKFDNVTGGRPHRHIIDISHFLFLS